MKDIEFMNPTEKTIVAYLNRKIQNKYFIFKLDMEKDGYYLGYAYPLWNPRMGDEHDKVYLKIDKQKFRSWKLHQILKKLD